MSFKVADVILRNYAQMDHWLVFKNKPIKKNPLRKRRGSNHYFTVPIGPKSTSST